MAKYFVGAEFACKCHRCEGKVNVGEGIHPRLFDVLDAIREKLGVPVYVTSGYRCPRHNKDVGGAKNSQHVIGTAADITYDGVDVDHLGRIAEACGADGIGLYWSQGFVHVDVRGEWARWDENNVG